MSINKIKTKKSFLTYLLFLIFFTIILIWHFKLPLWGDEIWFSKMYYQYNIFTFLSIRYETWTSRWLIEFFLLPIAALPRIMWIFFDSVIFTLIAVLIPKIILNTKKIDEKLFIYKYLSCVIVLIYIYTISTGLYSAGYIATTLNYIWPLFFGLLHFYLVKEYVFSANNSSTRKKIVIYVIMIFALIFAINLEVMLLAVSGTYFFIILYCFYNKVKIPNSVLIMLFIIFLGFLNVFLCPGNHLRYSSEIKTWFPDYYTLTFINKIDLGTTVLFNRIILSHSLINLCFFGIMSFYVYITTKKKIAILISLIPIIIIITLKLMVLIGYMPLVTFLAEGVTKYGLLYSNLKHIIVNSSIYMIVIFSVLYSLITVYKYGERKLSYIIFCLLILGFGSQMVKGFSPTVWASSERWEIYYYFCIALATYLLSVDLLGRFYSFKKF